MDVYIYFFFSSILRIKRESIIPVIFVFMMFLCLYYVIFFPFLFLCLSFFPSLSIVNLYLIHRHALSGGENILK